MTRSRTDAAAGDVLPGRTLHLDRAALVRYAGASLDRNPIHWDERFAQGVGLPDVIAHGMLTMGAAVQVVVDWAGDAGAVVSYGTKFVAPVVVAHDTGADVEIGGVVIVRPGRDHDAVADAALRLRAAAKARHRACEHRGGQTKAGHAHEMPPRDRAFAKPLELDQEVFFRDAVWSLRHDGHPCWTCWERAGSR